MIVRVVVSLKSVEKADLCRVPAPHKCSRGTHLASFSPGFPSIQAVMAMPTSTGPQ